MEKDLVLKILRYSPALGSIIGGVCLNLLIDRVIPGRKGRLRTERDHFFPEFKARDVRSEMEKRLVAEGFDLQQAADPNTLTASRKKRPKDSVMKEYPFEKLKLNIDVQFVSREDGCIAKMAVSTPEYITRDTGESDYFEAMLDYMMFRQDLHPMPPVEQMWAILTLRFSTILVFLPALLFLPGMEEDYASKFYEALMITSIAWFCSGGYAMIKIALSKGKYSGMRQAGIGMGLSVLAAIISTVIYMFAKG